MSKTVKVTYNADTLETTIVVDGKEFDTSRINGKEIADWAYPFMVRKVRWDGFYDEMVTALGGEKVFDLVFEGSEEALAELKEAWEDAPVNVVSGEQGNTVTIMYDADALTTEITVNGQTFDTTRINGKEIEDWVYPFMMRKVKWDGIFDELKKALGTDEYDIQFSGTRAAMKALMEDCPETVTITYQKNNKSTILSITESDSEPSAIVTPPTTLLNNTTDATELYQQGRTYYEYGNYQQAVNCFKEATDVGNSEAALCLGDCYKFGKGVAQSDEEALRCYAKSAELGNLNAQFEVGCCLYHGEGIQANRLAAFELYFNSAKSGNLVAKEMLEFLSEEGDLTAFEYCKKISPMAEKHKPRQKKPKPQTRRTYYAPSSKSYTPTVSGRTTAAVNYYDDSDEVDYKESFKFGVKIGTGAMKILGVLTVQPEITAAASAVEKIANSVIDGDVSSAFKSAYEGVTKLLSDEDE